MSETRRRVLLVDDERLARTGLKQLLLEHPDFEVVRECSNGREAIEALENEEFELVLLDIEMPEMDGLSFLEKIMALRPMPVVMISSLTQRGTAQSLRALELGVCDIIGKPNYDLQTNFVAMRQEILSKVRGAATAKIRPPAHLKKHVAKKATVKPAVDLIVIGASTGGVVAIREVLPLLPEGCPPILVVQHMPEAYTSGLAERLDLMSRVTVVESQDKMPLEAGKVYIAHGGQHLRVAKKGTKYELEHGDDENVSGHKPSVDALFESVVENFDGKVVGVIMTGMGRDGARGMLALRRAGHYTIGQSEDSCVVYGMPRVAMEVGGVEEQVPLSKIATTIEGRCWPNKKN